MNIQQEQEESNTRECRKYHYSPSSMSLTGEHQCFTSMLYYFLDWMRGRVFMQVDELHVI